MRLSSQPFYEVAVTLILPTLMRLVFYITSPGLSIVSNSDTRALTQQRRAEMFKIIVQACLIMSIMFSLSARAEDPMAPIVSKYCTPTEVAVIFNSRLHIKCRSPLHTGYYGEIYVYFFSLSTNDPVNVDYAMQIGTRAIAAGKRLKLWVRTSASYNPSGCKSSNCRKLTGITLLD